MFKLIAALFVITNGVPADEPAGVMSYKERLFDTEMACKDFVVSDGGRAVIAPIARAASSMGMVVGVACTKATEDNTI